MGRRIGGRSSWGRNKSSPKSYAKVERNRNDAVDPMCNIRSLWIATVTLTPPQDEGVIRLNPIGLYLRDFDWTAQL